MARGGRGGLPETPKPGDPAFAAARSLLVGTNRVALAASAEEARARGYDVMVLSSRVRGEAREVAEVLLGVGEDIAASDRPIRRPACLLAGGETTVTLRGRGSGGRNQEMALAFARALRSSPYRDRILLLAASTDGSDGPTDAAGAFASAAVLDRAEALGLDPEAFLAENDSYRFFDAAGGLLRTGPTGTNVCDIQALIVS